MPIVNEGLTQYSQIVKAASKIESEGAGNFHFARVNVVGSVADIDIMGLPVVFNGTNFEPYAAQDIAAVVASTLPNAAPVALVVGSKMGKGINKEKVTLTASAVEYTVIFRGEAIVANLPTAANAAFKVALEKQGIAIQAAAEVVAPTF
mgnify:CR=1 FL=1|tara:strand:- start:119 stop:565 length:447 start_codon:yes stop_codon:yes gene_type:complete